MASSKYEVLEDVREITGYEDFVIDNDELETCFSRAQRYIANAKGLDADSTEWYTNEKLEDALFWYTAFLAKIAAGELDSPAGEVENVQISKFSATESEWYRRAQQALRSVRAPASSGSGGRVGSVQRSDRTYGSEDTDVL